MKSVRGVRGLVLAVLVVLALVVAPAAQAAIVTLDFASFGSGAVVVNFDYNEGNGNVLRFRCINNSDQSAWFGVYLMDYTTDPPGETLVGERVCLPHETITQNIPGVSMAWDLVDGGIMMGNYQFRARYPAS
jgi:hypothetical protein